MESEDDDYGSGYNCEPLWRHVDILELEESDQLDEDHVKFLCDYCNRVFHGNYSKLEEHLLKVYGGDACIGVTKIIRAQLESEVAAAKDLNGSTPRQVSLTQSSTSSYSGCMSVTSKAIIQPGKRMKSTDLDDDFCDKLRNFLDATIARLFYSSGLSLYVALNPHFRNTFSLATGKKDIPGRTDGENDLENQELWNHQITSIFLFADLPFNLQRNPYYHFALSLATSFHIPGYVPPGPGKLTTTLLKKERAHIERLLETIKSTWKKAGVTIVCDGWSDIERRPVINILAVTESGPVFLDAIYNEDEVKTKDYIAEKLIAAIEDVGPENVVQVITDNDPICRDAGLLIEERYNHIHWTPSVVHTLSLVLKQICAAMSTENVALKDCQWISEVVDAALVIKSFILDHSTVLSMFKEFSKLKMLTIAETRFASHIVMLKRFKLIKESLQGMVMSDQWSAYKKDNVGQAEAVRKNLLDDSWWDQVDYILAFTEPIYLMIRFVDTEKSCLHLIYEMWNNMIEKVKAAIYKHEGKAPEEESAFYSVVHGILVDGWNHIKNPLGCLAHTLNPRYYSDSWTNEDANHLPPHCDAWISEMTNGCLEKLFPAADDLKAVNEEYAEFAHLGIEYFSMDSIIDRDILDPKTWWVTHGASVPKLQSLALKLLSLPASSSCYERNWSTYRFIRKIMKIKHRVEWANDLVFVHTNLRLRARTLDEYYTHPQFMMWDAEEGSFEANFIVGVLESASLSLHEPEFELAMMEKEERENGDEDDEPEFEPAMMEECENNDQDDYRV